MINEAFAWRLGAAAGRLAREGGAAEKAHVFIGRDTRGSGPVLERALAGGLASAGLMPVSLGVVPTPAVSLAVRKGGAAFGAVITASHNPACDNGIKFFRADGIKLTDKEEMRLEQLLPATAGAPLDGPLATYDARSLYITTATGLLAADALRGWRIVLDTANGATAETSRGVLAALGAELELIGNAPDGMNINAGVGSQHPEVMSARVRATGAQLGLAHDGDGDRCILCDELGEALDGDEMLAILAAQALREDRLAAGTLVVTVQSNLGVDSALARLGGRVHRTPVGDRYVIEQMLALGATLGGESSGHVICTEVAPTGDGLVAALKIMAVMRSTGRPLSELRRVLRKFPQRSAALTVAQKRPLATLVALPVAIQAIRDELGTRGRVLVRYSGTEPKLRLLVEGESDAVVQACLHRLIASARQDLEVTGD